MTAFKTEGEVTRKQLGNITKKTESKTDNTLPPSYFHIIPAIIATASSQKRVRVFLYMEFTCPPPSPHLFHNIGKRVTQLLALHAEKLNVRQEGIDLLFTPQEGLHGQ